MPLVSAVLMCHAPIVIPAVAGARAERCAQSTAAMRRIARALVEAAPDVVVVISPHTPRPRHAFLIVAPPLGVDFSPFGAPQIAFEPCADPLASSALAQALTDNGRRAVIEPVQPLDHGAGVPLYFLDHAGYRGPVVVVGFPSPCTFDETTALGRAIAHLAGADGRRWAVLASGDMSHRLRPGAPAGFDPDAAKFDRAFVSAVGDGDFERAFSIDADLRARAAEDVVDAVHVAVNALSDTPLRPRVESYEGPFGVGYLNAILHGSAGSPDEGDPCR